MKQVQQEKGGTVDGYVYPRASAFSNWWIRNDSPSPLSGDPTAFISVIYQLRVESDFTGSIKKKEEKRKKEQQEAPFIKPAGTNIHIWNKLYYSSLSLSYPF